MLLKIEGFETAVAINGTDALDQLDRVQPDPIITDYMMPLMSGGEMAERIRGMARHAEVPIVMTSATDEQQVARYAAHYDVFHRKPYLWEDLFASINKLLA